MSDDEMAEWREQIGPRVFLEMVCTHYFKGGVCDICWGNTQRACRFIEAAELARQEAQNEVNILSAELAEMRGRLNASRVLLANARSVMDGHAVALRNALADERRISADARRLLAENAQTRDKS